jgi:hypothetical protein
VVFPDFRGWKLIFLSSCSVAKLLVRSVFQLFDERNSRPPMFGSTLRIIYHKNLRSTVQCVMDADRLFRYKPFVILNYLSAVTFLRRRRRRNSYQMRNIRVFLTVSVRVPPRTLLKFSVTLLQFSCYIPKTVSVECSCGFYRI